MKTELLAECDIFPALSLTLGDETHNLKTCVFHNKYEFYRGLNVTRICKKKS